MLKYQLPFQPEEQPEETKAKQQRVKMLVVEMLENLPPMVKMMAQTYLNSYLPMVDTLEDEKINELLDWLQAKIDFVRFGDPQ